MENDQIFNLDKHMYPLVIESRNNNLKNRFNSILEKRLWNQNGYSEDEIRFLLNYLSLLDSNNFSSFCGLGEREGRVFSRLVRERHFGFSHGIGRSGDLTASQPKAVGSSYLSSLTNDLVLHWIKNSCPNVKKAIIIPMATGMTINLVLSAFKKRRRDHSKYVIWSRIDQKSCFKSMIAANLIPIPIEPIKSTDGDEYKTNLSDIEIAIQSPEKYLKEKHPEVFDTYQDLPTGPDSIVAVISTTSCFAPRIPDNVNAVTRVCMKYSIPHLVNNAYGMQSSKIMRKINGCYQETLRSDKRCGIDFVFVQSCDKNLMVPVGGSVVASFDEEVVDFISKSYPGRASASTTTDVFITLLEMGRTTWNRLVTEREENFKHLHDRIERLIELKDLPIRLLKTPDNPISLAISFGGPNGDKVTPKVLTQIGSHLFSKGCTGARVVIAASQSEGKNISGYLFRGFNSHSSSSQDSYLNVASAIGQKRTEIDDFIGLLEKTLVKFLK